MEERGGGGGGGRRGGRSEWTGRAGRGKNWEVGVMGR